MLWYTFSKDVKFQFKQVVPRKEQSDTTLIAEAALITHPPSQVEHHERQMKQWLMIWKREDDFPNAKN